MTAIPSWVTDNPIERHTTEVLLPMVLKVGPVATFDDDRRGWYGAIEVYGAEGEPVFECEDFHDDKEAALVCAAAALAELVESVRHRLGGIPPE